MTETWDAKQRNARNLLTVHGDAASLRRMASPTTQIAVRLDHELLARVDAIAEKLSEEWSASGRKASRSDALRAIILAGLAATEPPPPRPVQKQRRKGR